MYPLTEILIEIDDIIAGLSEYDATGHILWNQFRDMVVKKINKLNK